MLQLMFGIKCCCGLLVVIKLEIVHSRSFKAAILDDASYIFADLHWYTVKLGMNAESQRLASICLWFIAVHHKLEINLDHFISCHQQHQGLRSLMMTRAIVVCNLDINSGELCWQGASVVGRLTIMCCHFVLFTIAFCNMTSLKPDFLE